MCDPVILEDEVLSVSIGQVSEKGRKEQNEDSLGFYIPDDVSCFHKGIVAVIADGVSTAEAGKEASETCVKNFLSDYFSTPDSWSVKTSVQRILSALNRWLYSQSIGQYSVNRGYISTLSAIVLHGELAHVFHIGDSRVYRLRDNHFERLTRDHTHRVNEETCYLTRAMGMDVNLEVDYFCTSLEAGDAFFLSTDGVHDFLVDTDIRHIIQAELDSVAVDLHRCCGRIVERALANGSDDNLSCQLIQFHIMPYMLNKALNRRANGANLHLNFLNLPFLEPLKKGDTVDGLWVMEVLSRDAMYYEYLVKEVGNGKTFVLRAPVKRLEHDIQFKSHFVLEPWAANIVKHPQILNYPLDGKYKHFFYYLREYDSSLTLKDWMVQRKSILLEECLDITHQLLEIVHYLHQKDIVMLNLSSENILIDAHGTIKLSDFSACFIQDMPETRVSAYRNKLTTAYAAPEFLCDEKPAFSADIFSISVIAYSLMTNAMPYKSNYLSCSSLNDYFKLKYQSMTSINPLVPDWLEAVLKKGLSILARQRFSQLEDMRQALKSPSLPLQETVQQNSSSTEKWKILCGFLLITQVISLVWLLV